MKDAAAKAEPSSEILIACVAVLKAQHFTLGPPQPVRVQVHLHAAILQQGYFIPLLNLANTATLSTQSDPLRGTNTETSGAGGHEGMKNDMQSAKEGRLLLVLWCFFASIGSRVAADLTLDFRPADVSAGKQIVICQRAHGLSRC